MADMLLMCCFIILTGYFAGVETAFVCSDRYRLKSFNLKTYNKFKVYFIDPERFFTTTLIGNNICVILASTFLTSFLLEKGVKDTELVNTLILTPLVLIFGEMFPKCIGRVFREKYIIKTSAFYLMWERILRVLSFLIKKITVKVKEKFQFSTKNTWGSEDIKILISALQSTGEIDRSEKEAIDDVFSFYKKSVKDIVRTKNEVVAFDYSESKNIILERAAQARHTRYPVYRSQEVIGYINIFDLFYNESQNWRHFIRPITFVGANQKLGEVFSILTRKHESIAFVQRGSRKLGMVTLVDLMQEITNSIIK